MSSNNYLKRELEIEIIPDFPNTKYKPLIDSLRDTNKTPKKGVSIRKKGD